MAFQAGCVDTCGFIALFSLMTAHVTGNFVLMVNCAALYVYNLHRSWRAVYAAGAVTCLYLNVFVLVVQRFLKIPMLHELAPKGSEPPFAIAQGVVLVLFVVLGILAVRQFRPSVLGDPVTGR